MTCIIFQHQHLSDAYMFYTCSYFFFCVCIIHVWSPLSDPDIQIEQRKVISPSKSTRFSIVFTCRNSQRYTNGITLKPTVVTLVYNTRMAIFGSLAFTTASKLSRYCRKKSTLLYTGDGLYIGGLIFLDQTD